MNFQSDYLNIHEKAYQHLRNEGKLSWSESDDLQERISFYKEVLLQQLSASQSKILVLGCGDGETSISLATLGHEVTGIDISPTAIEWASEKAVERGINCSFVVKNLASRESGLGKFDLIIDDHCLHCIVGPDRVIALSRVSSALSQQGCFVMRTQCGDPPSSCSPEVLNTWDPVSRCQIHKGIAGRYFGLPESIRGELVQAGLQILRDRVFTYPSGWSMFEAVARRAAT